jgi:hypothetical protein
MKGALPILQYAAGESFVYCGSQVLYGEVNRANPAGEDLADGIAFGMAHA